MKPDLSGKLPLTSPVMRQWYLSSAVLEFELSTSARRRYFLAALALVCLPLAYVGGKAAIAETLSESQNTELLTWGLRIDPSQPHMYYQLGLLKQYSLDASDSVLAVRYLRTATELGPARGYSWLALAAALEDAGDMRGSQTAIQRALECRPMSPRYWWRAGNISLRAGESEATWTYFRRVLELSLGYSELVFQLGRGVGGDYRIISEKVLPTDGPLMIRLAYADFLSRHGDFDAAFQMWHDIESRQPLGQLTAAGIQPYLNRLMDHKRLAEAETVWRDMLKWQIVANSPSARPQNAVFNGDFEQSPLDLGFDWRVTKAPFVSTDLQAAPAYQGAKSLGVDFTVSNNDEYEIVYQIVPVETCRTFSLEAFARSEGITSDSGPGLRVTDAEVPERLIASTPALIGTTEWRRLGTTFITGPDTHFVRIALWRGRSRTFPTGISGRFWLDDVSLVAADPPGHSDPVRHMCVQ